jgi:type IV pilus assembly protein PilB
MKLDDAKLREVLLRENYISNEDLTKADEYIKFHHSSLVDYLLTQQIVNKYLLGQAIAESFKVPYVDLSGNQPSKERVLRIPERLALKYHVVVASEDDNTATVATDDPSPVGLKDTLEHELKKSVTITFALFEDIEPAFVYYRKALETRFSKIIARKKRIAPELIAEILDDAIAFHASDIHFEPQEDSVQIRFRIDGVLREAGEISREYYANILNRIKVQAHLRTDEHMAAQDGAIRFKTKKDDLVDLRVSIAPTLDGEKVVIRLLAEYVKSFTLSDLGLSPNDQKLLAGASKKPFGMLLVTGPTGSGKTTTLYGLLKMLNHPEVNIMTIEDPVEYKIVGVNHIQVNPQAHLTFAKGLRSIVRQDPNVILVGEIRDKETAEISVNAALTGHLLLSTFHANDAATSIPRLLDMGVEPFLLASTLEVIVSQRLVRTICGNCRISLSNHERVYQLLPQADQYFPDKMPLFEGKGCGACNGTGYKGRTALFEIIYVTREMENLILTHPSTQQIWDLARTQGAHSMFKDGIEKVKLGVTTVDELLRVSTPPGSNESYGT